MSVSRIKRQTLHITILLLLVTLFLMGVVLGLEVDTLTLPEFRPRELPQLRDVPDSNPILPEDYGLA